MTGPEHYREAERLAAESYHEDRWEADDKLLARAQVHATLALAAATALMHPFPENAYRPAREDNAWEDAAATKTVSGP